MKKKKEKPTAIKHKFQSFQERVDQISVNVVKRNFQYDPGESRSFFCESLRNLFDLNIEPFKTLRYKFDIDLTQLLFAKENVVDELLKSLKTSNAIIVGHLLNLISSLARDLQGELFVFFDRFFIAIKSTIDQFHHNTEVLEHCFTCLSFLIYYAKDTARNDVESIIKVVQPLLCSPKQYIQHFMAESLAYLIRKAPDHKRLFAFIFTTYGDKPEMASACGHILAETLRGVRVADNGGKLHSLADRLLPALLEVLTSCEDAADQQRLVGDTLRHAYTILMAHCSPRHASLLWRLPARALRSTARTAAFQQLCDLLSELVEFRHGRLVTMECAEELFQVLTDIVDCMDSPNLRQLMALTLVHCQSTEKRIQFLRQLFSHSDSLPTRLLLVEEAAILGDEAVRGLVRVHLLPMGLQVAAMRQESREPLLRTLLSLAESGEALDFSVLPRKNALSCFLGDALAGCEDEATALPCLRLLNHVTPLSQDALLPLLPTLVATFLPARKVMDAADVSENRLIIARLLTRLAVRLDVADAAVVPLVRLLRRCRAACSRDDACAEEAAGALQLHLGKWTPGGDLPPRLLKAVTERLSQRLRSPRHQMRRLALLCLLRLCPAATAEEEAAVRHALGSGLAAEEVHPVGLHNHREAARLTGDLCAPRLLLRVRCGRPEPEDEEAKAKEEREVESAAGLAIRLLLGRLWINFRELWQDTIDALVSLAQVCRRKFWEEVLPVLVQHTDACMGPAVTHEDASYLALLWRTAAAVPVHCLRSEVRQALILKTMDFHENGYSALRTARNTKLLVEMLTLVAGFDNLSRLDLGRRLDDLLLALLCDRHDDVQRAAFRGLAAYHARKMRRYAEPFAAVLGRAGLQTGLLRLPLDDEEAVVPGHRKIVGEVLLRILYGKMQHRAGDRNRALLVFAYIGEHCDAREMDYFLGLVFSHFLDALEPQVERRADAAGLHALVTAHAADLCRRLDARSAGLLQGTCRTLSLLLDSLHSQRVTAHAPRLLHLLLTVLATVHRYRRSQREATAVGDEAMEEEKEEEEEGEEAMEEDEDETEAGPHIKLSQFRGLRQAASDLLFHFLSSFADFAWTEAELRVLRAVAVEPQLARLHHEGLSTPGLCLRLVAAWSAAPRFLHLLAGDGEQDAVGATVRLMGHGKAASAVVDMCLSVLRNLLEEDAQPLGLDLLRPHLTSVVALLSSRVAASPSAGLDSELRLLTSLSPHLSDRAACLPLLSALLSHLLRLSRARLDHASEQAQVTLLRAAAALLAAQPASPERAALVRRALALFSRIRGRAARQALVELVSGEDAAMGALAAPLNSWQRERVEARDVERRQQAYAAAAGGEGRLVAVHCAVHDLLHDPDMRPVAAAFLERVIPALGGDEAPLLLGVVWPAVKAGLRRDVDQLHLQRLLRLVEKIGESGLAAVRAIGVLTAAREEAAPSLWEGLASFNVGRNMAAMRQLGGVLQARGAEIPVDIVRHLLLRLVWIFLHRRAAHKKDAGDERTNQRMHNLGEVAAALLETIAGRLPWNAYKQLLMAALNDLERAAGGQAAVSGIESARNRMLVSVIVYILNGFHFLDGSSEAAPAPEPAEKESGDEDNEDEAMEEEEEAPTAIGSFDDAIRDFLGRHVLPRLEKHIARRHSLEERHKLAQKTPAKEGESLEVPIALAVVKLAKLLPVQVMETKLRKVFYRVCEFLRSPRYSTRVEAGATLVKILVSLGMPFFHFMLREMTLCLSRGFQRHVLVLTVFHLLRGMLDAEALTNGCFADAVVNQLQDLCFDDLFGELSEEKKVEAITKKLPEAKKSKAQEILHLMVRFLDANQLDAFFKRLKEESFKIRKKEPLRRFERLLSCLQSRDAVLANSAATPRTLLILIHRTLTDSLPQLRLAEADQLAAKRRAASADLRAEEAPVNPWDARADSLLLEAEPRRAKPVDLRVSKTNAHLLADFGLRLLLHLLRAGDAAEAMLSPLLPAVVAGLASQHSRVAVGALRALHCLQQAGGARMGAEAEAAAARAVFRLLNERARFGGGAGASEETAELLSTLFKVAAAFVKESEAVGSGDLSLLTDLVHAELMATRSGCANTHRVATTFTLLRAIVHRRNNARKRVSDDMVETFGTQKHASFADLIHLLEQVCVTSEMEHVREQARLCLAAYLTSQRISWFEFERRVTFLLHQLRYPVASGRMSALLLLEVILKSLPAEVSLRRTKRLELFFTKMAVELEREPSVNDSVIAHYNDTFRAVLSALTAGGSRPDAAESMWATTENLIKADKLSVRLAGLRIASAFLPRDGGQADLYISLTTGLSGLLVTAGQRLVSEAPGKEEREENGGEASGRSEESAETQQMIADRVAEMVVSLLNQTGDDRAEVYNLLETLLLHRSLVVREAAMNRFAALLVHREDPLDHPYFVQAQETGSRLATLVYRLFDQLKSPAVSHAWCDGVVKAMVRAAACVRTGPDERTRPLTVDWLFHRWNREAVHETQRLNKHTVRRCGALKFVAAVVTKVTDDEALLGHIAKLMGREQRQLDRHTDEALKTLIEDSFKLFSTRFGQRLTEAMADEAKEKRMLKRKKEQLAELAVIDGASFAAKKMKKNRRADTDVIKGRY